MNIVISNKTTSLSFVTLHSPNDHRYKPTELIWFF